jgi:RNA polymerase sigma-70 factor, ECF subfamily
MRFVRNLPLLHYYPPQCSCIDSMPLKTFTHRKAGYRGAIAIIERDGKILMQRRCEHIADPGTWVLPGGEVKRTEEPRETLVRICGEELGISVRPSMEIGVCTINEQPCPVWKVIWKGKDVKLSGNEIIGIGWFTPEELLELEPVRHQEELRVLLKTTPFFRDLAEAPLTHEEDDEPENIDNATVMALVIQAQKGDHEAFGKIYDRFVTPIHRYVAFRLPPAVVEDIVSDVFLKAWEKLDSYRGRRGTPFSSWLFRIAHNIVIDTYRTQKETNELHEFHIDEDRWNDPKLKITQDMQAALLRRAMNKLPKRYREVLLLSFMSGLSHMEIARAMRTREGGVRILKHRALKKLGEHLPASMRDELP